MIKEEPGASPERSFELKAEGKEGEQWPRQSQHHTPRANDGKVLVCQESARP